jgi:large subunit ribosomal protein L23
MDLDPHQIVLKPLTTEKVFTQMEEENTLAFIVSPKANKNQIKWAIEKLFEVKVEKVRTLITTKNEKKAYIKLAEGYLASDLATDLGLF